MPQTTQCKSCGIILNLPDKVAAGKRMRCPKCGLRFVVTVADASSESTFAAPMDAEATISAFNLPMIDGKPDDLPLPMADRDLRETFELPLVNAREAERAGASPAAAAIGDAASLFADDPGPRRRGTIGDARSRARRCSNCGGLVPQGMSICVSCGVDQETGMRVGLEDDLAPPPPPPPSGPPIHVTVVGGLLGVGALILFVLSLVKSVGVAQGWENYGWLCLAAVSGFSIFAAVQFIRLKTVKLLMVALTLGVVVNLMAFIAKPVFLAFQDTGQVMSPARPSDDPDDAGVIIPPFEERFDTVSFKIGITVLVIYAILSVYLMSPAVKKPFNRAQASASW
jgi:hypothetical protein